ncbi:MAG: recombinase family protein [Clostridia bacterium]|nr:recombinase family protein [Clostridia bacterium]
MKKAVIYARYSSERQNEQSIAGQVGTCTKWASDNNVEIIRTYHDEALTGKSDKRPQFQQMIKDAKNEEFLYILVYKLDRFARNRYDSAIYKAQLKKYNVRVISVMESIAEGPEGIILESVLEGMAEYYSANLSQNVLRAMHQRAELGKYMGGTPPLGYTIDKEKNYIIDSDKAAIVRMIFERYSQGDTVKKICSDLNLSGYTNTVGKPFNSGSFNAILKNEKYIGVYDCMGHRIENALPRIIDDDLFYKVQRRMKHNKKRPAASKAKVNYYLAGKLFCGKCGSNMIGDCGTANSGIRHYYYTCAKRKKGRVCKKKSVKKDYIEQLVTDIAIKEVLTDKNIELIAEQVYIFNEKERADKSELQSLKKSLAETQKAIDNILKAIEQGIITESTKERLISAEERRETLFDAIANEEVKKPALSKEQIECFLYDVKNRVYDADDRIDVIIRTFVNSVYLYDDKIILTFNLKEGKDLKTVELEYLQKFDFEKSGCTKKTEMSTGISVFCTTKIREIING